MTMENDPRRRVGRAARHRQRAVEVLQPRDARALQGNRWKLLPPASGVGLELNDLDLDVVPYGVVRAHRAIDDAAIVEPAVDVLQEVGGGDRRVHAVHLHLDRTLLGFEHHDRRSPRLDLRGRRGGENRSRQQGTHSPKRHDHHPLKSFEACFSGAPAGRPSLWQEL